MKPFKVTVYVVKRTIDPFTFNEFSWRASNGSATIEYVWNVCSLQSIRNSIRRVLGVYGKDMWYFSKDSIIQKITKSRKVVSPH